MTKTQKTATPVHARTAAEIRKAQKAWRATVTLAEVRTDTRRFAQSHADLRSFAQVDTLDGQIAEATTAVERISAELKDARGVVRTLSALREAAMDIARQDAIWLVREVGVSQRAAGRIVGVSDKTVGNWLNPERKAKEVKANSAKRGQERAAKRETTAPTAKEVKAHLSASAALLAGLETASVADVRALEARVAAITAALADLQGRSAQANRDAGRGVAAPGTAGSAA